MISGGVCKLCPSFSPSPSTLYFNTVNIAGYHCITCINLFVSFRFVFFLKYRIDKMTRYTRHYCLHYCIVSSYQSAAKNAAIDESGG